MSEPSRDAVALALPYYCDLSRADVRRLVSDLADSQAEVRRLEAELGRRGAAPDGWRLVPVEPTAAMRAAFRADEEPHLFFFTTVAICDFDQRYRAMLGEADAALSALLDAPPDKNLGSS